MALVKSKFSHLPDDAVVLTEQQALQYQSELINKWHRTSDVLALRYGPYILGGATTLSSFIVNNYFRNKFKLGSIGRISTYFPVCLMPATISMLVHAELVLSNVILLKGDQCPVCLELRSAAIQSVVATLFPFVIAPVGCASLAQRYATINLPYVTDRPGEVLNIFKKMVKPFRTTMWYMFVGQALLGSIVTYFEIKSIITVNQKLALEEHKEQYS